MKFKKLKQKIKKSTPSPQKNKFKNAGHIERIKAFIVDMFMIYIPLLYLITYGVLGGKDAFQASQIAQLIAVGLYAFIDAIFTYKTGQTPGKRAYELEVLTQENYKHPSFLRSFFRFLAFLLSATSLLGLLVGFYRKDKRALHDILTKTTLVEKKT